MWYPTLTKMENEMEAPTRMELIPWTPILSTEGRSFETITEQASYCTLGLLTQGFLRLKVNGAGYPGEISISMPTSLDESMLGKPIGTAMIHDASALYDYGFMLVPWSTSTATFSRAFNTTGNSMTVVPATGDIVTATFAYQSPVRE